jgi:hypothetical protein
MAGYVTRCAESFFGFLVRMTANFLGAVLSHPSVETAVAKCIVRGMNDFLTQDELDRHVKTMSATMQRNQPELARNAGQDFPKIVGSFFQGMLSPRKEKQLQDDVTPPQAANSTNNANGANSSVTAGTVAKTPPSTRSHSPMRISNQDAKVLVFPLIRKEDVAHSSQGRLRLRHNAVAASDTASVSDEDDDDIKSS